MLETEHGKFELVKEYRDSFILADFNKRYLDIFNVYPYVVGDYSAGLLRLKGFTKSNYKEIPDYLAESCAPGCAYYILENSSFNPNLKYKE